MEDKITTDFILDQYGTAAYHYKEYALNVGLWKSEEYVFRKHVITSSKILDLGCGAGRTTFALYDLGYHGIVGVDLTPEMIEAALDVKKQLEIEVSFYVGDATDLNYENQSFDVVFFSFNGMMSIPSQAKRDQALNEIRRILKPDGLYIFTTHDQDMEPHFLEFWKEEKIKWTNGDQDPRLYDYGDIIASSKNEVRDIFIHIPTMNEIDQWLKANGWELLETFYRNEKFIESEAVKEKSGDCRFWVARKK
ncbi:MAG: class I SAM-dependent methyltransferase [Saprospiraceae bacterium]|nr:class I SAM-dependent methyltransferase [Saprospiraceae bacterium]